MRYGHEKTPEQAAAERIVSLELLAQAKRNRDELFKRLGIE